MDFRERGRPPYQVSSGTADHLPGPEHWSGAENYGAALAIIADLSEFGRIPGNERIIDSTGRTIFSVERVMDRRMLQDADRTGINVIPRKP